MRACLTRAPRWMPMPPAPQDSAVVDLPPWIPSGHVEGFRWLGGGASVGQGYGGVVDGVGGVELGGGQGRMMGGFIGSGNRWFPCDWSTGLYSHMQNV